jgi:hypothetical protein
MKNSLQNSISSYYLDGPIIFASHTLQELVHRKNTTWLGLQHILQVTKYRDIVDYQLLLKFIVTDRISINDHDSFANRFKFYLSFEEVLAFHEQLVNINTQIANSLSVAQKSRCFRVPINSRVQMSLEAFINENANPMIAIRLLDQVGESFPVIMNLYTYKAFIQSLYNTINSWHNILSLSYYTLQISTRSLKIHLMSVDDKLSKLQNNGVYDSYPSSSNNNRFINLNPEIVSQNQLEVQQTIFHKLESIVQNLGIQQYITEEVSDRNPQESYEIIDQETSTSNNDQNLQEKELDEVQDNEKRKESENQKLPLELIDKLSQLKSYLLDETIDIPQFVQQHYETLKNLFINNGVTFLNDTQADLIKALFELKSIFESGVRPKTFLGSMLYEILNEEVQNVG